jgi:hypothetical protein
MCEKLGLTLRVFAKRVLRRCWALEGRSDGIIMEKMCFIICTLHKAL